ncbi:MAG: response regulator transcription factor [Clostridiales bacterium]|jgi:DNA-binding response OmpR family regulator|nr:response regulator transcription factor [Clostridiales bacterium]
MPEDEKRKILIIEDEKKLARFVELELLHEGYEVDTAHDGEAGLSAFLGGSYDLVLLDLMLPKLNGMEITRRIRKNSDVPIIMITARGEVMDKVVGLDSGADDYITKPFAIEELLARMRTAFRRRPAPGGDFKEDALTLGGLRLELKSRAVSVNGAEVELTKTEFDLLAYMLKNQGIVLTREQILNNVWGYDYLGETNVVDVYIRYLRSKIDDAFGEKLIYTARGVGYVAKKTKDENVDSE